MNHRIILVLKVKLTDDCEFKYDSWEDILNCLKCKNSDYRMVDLHGAIVRDFKYSSMNRDQSEILDIGYTINFKESISNDNLEEFIMNPNNDYQVTRIKDHQVLKKFKPVVKERGIEKIKKYFKR